MEMNVFNLIEIHPIIVDISLKTTQVALEEKAGVHQSH